MTMNMNVSREDLLSALATGASLSGHNKAIAILECALVRINERGIIISSSDGDNLIKCRCSALDLDGDAEFTINAKDFIGAVGSMAAPIITLTHDGATLTITAGKARMSFPTGDTADFPDIAHGEENARARVGGDALAELDRCMREASVFCEKSDLLKPALNCVSVNFTEHGIAIYGTDANILYVHDIARTNDMDYGNMTFLIHNNIAKAFSEVMTSGKEATITDYTDKVSVRSEDAVLLVSKVQKKYPNVMAVVPTDDQPVRVTFNATDLNATLKRAGIAANLNSPIVKFNVKCLGVCEISSECLDFNKGMTEEMDAEVNAARDMRIGFALNKLRLATPVLKGAVTLSFSAPEKSTLWTSDQDAATRIVVMPVYLND